MGGRRIPDETKQRAEQMLRETNLTQATIAQRLGISQSSVSRINTSTVHRPRVSNSSSYTPSFENSNSFGFSSNPQTGVLFNYDSPLSSLSNFNSNSHQNVESTKPKQIDERLHKEKCLEYDMKIINLERKIAEMTNCKGENTQLKTDLKYSKVENDKLTREIDSLNGKLSETQLQAGNIKKTLENKNKELEEYLAVSKVKENQFNFRINELERTNKDLSAKLKTENQKTKEIYTNLLHFQEKFAISDAELKNVNHDFDVLLKYIISNEKVPLEKTTLLKSSKNVHEINGTNNTINNPFEKQNVKIHDAFREIDRLKSLKENLLKENEIRDEKNCETSKKIEKLENENKVLKEKLAENINKDKLNYLDIVLNLEKVHNQNNTLLEVLQLKEARDKNILKQLMYQLQINNDQISFDNIVNSVEKWSNKMMLREKNVRHELKFEAQNEKNTMKQIIADHEIVLVDLKCKLTDLNETVNGVQARDHLHKSNLEEKINNDASNIVLKLQEIIKINSKEIDLLIDQKYKLANSIELLETQQRQNQQHELSIKQENVNAISQKELENFTLSTIVSKEKEPIENISNQTFCHAIQLVKDNSNVLSVIIDALKSQQKHEIKSEFVIKTDQAFDSKISVIKTQKLKVFGVKGFESNLKERNKLVNELKLAQTAKMLPKIGKKPAQIQKFKFLNDRLVPKDRDLEVEKIESNELNLANDHNETTKIFQLREDNIFRRPTHTQHYNSNNNNILGFFNDRSIADEFTTFGTMVSDQIRHMPFSEQRRFKSVIFNFLENLKL